MRSSVIISMSCGELPVSADGIFRSMGYSSDPPEHIAESLEGLLKEVGRRVVPQAGYVLYEDPPALEQAAVSFGGQDFRTGKVIGKYLEGVEKIAVFAVTAGEAMQELIREASESGDVFNQFMLDAVGSEIAECAADKIEALIRAESQGDGLGITNRFSPGYCGWHVREQKKLFALLPDKFCGITLSESSLMYPLKSVSGIIGMGPQVVRREYNCELCEDSKCLRRKGPRVREE